MLVLTDRVVNASSTVPAVGVEGFPGEHSLSAFAILKLLIEDFQHNAGLLPVLNLHRHEQSVKDTGIVSK